MPEITDPNWVQIPRPWESDSDGYGKDPYGQGPYGSPTTVGEEYERITWTEVT